jgi:hypothetical protein
LWCTSEVLMQKCGSSSTRNVQALAADGKMLFGYEPVPTWDTSCAIRLFACKAQEFHAAVSMSVQNVPLAEVAWGSKLGRLPTGSEGPTLSWLCKQSVRDIDDGLGFPLCMTGPTSTDTAALQAEV